MKLNELTLKFKQCLNVLVALFILMSVSYAQPLREFRAVKITNVDSDILFDDQKIAEGMNYLASIGINVILPVVWNSHAADGDYTLYPSEVMENYFGRAMHPVIPAGRDPLQRVIIEAHRNGMEVLPWFEMGFSTSYSQNGGHILRQYPNWALKDNQGRLAVKNGFDWMSGIHPEVQQFMISLVTEIMDKYDVDGIEFSDRIPAMPVEGGYEDATKAIYAAEHNGAAPPTNFNDAAWMRWRANKLSQFYQLVRDSVKVRGEHLIVSSSPSVYPWSYEEYLQDSKTWFDSNIIDNLIPQLYRYSFAEYQFELDKALSYIPANRRDVFFSGMLIYLRGENYLITPDFLLRSIKANRDRNVAGEAFFFYEGLRLQHNRLGDTLKATYYSQPARVPYRHGQIWRPKALIINEDDSSAVVSGNWEKSSIAGFRPNILIQKDGSYSTITYFFDVPFAAWYDVYAYNVTGSLASNRTPCTVYQASDSVTVYLNQQGLYKAGWQPLTSAYLQSGRQKVLTISNKDVPAGQFVVADAAMIMINRKLSPDVVVTDVYSMPATDNSSPADFFLDQNYPNPFNAQTTIGFYLERSRHVLLRIFDINARQVAVLCDGIFQAGRHEVVFRADGLASGMYFCNLQLGNQHQSTKLLLLK
ncbi:MAG: family 10 glycosylhydrolase [candidate division KSB1 bacterium]|nr:family 10 glycosylhydrolase [candidate division KSB1 bacterium]MDZ7318547.1 family 10 glycosylhydrolase [candidate division KSB1 bacterium]MDZ7342811.1 family 10 glycosylhydrolase [candidate division KSB1 bacterium]